MGESVRDQVQRILDEGQGERRSVIVQMTATREPWREKLAVAAARAVEERRSTTSARDLLPIAREQLVARPTGRRASAAAAAEAARAAARSAGPSMTAQLAALHAPEADAAAQETGARAT
ncbi:MAG: hypothetical protein HZA54_17265, partial [Planctomycetes bacterium]|nr:hypothetical protein [Planctomycetota bacterium]